MPSEPTKIQRFLTSQFISKRRLNAPVIPLRPGATSPLEGELAPPDLEIWANGDDERNLGVRLMDGFIEIKIQSPDDIWTKCLFQACKGLHVDARAAYGRATGPISSILFHIADPPSVDAWDNRWPRGHKDKGGNWVEAKLVHSLNGRAKPLWRDSSPLPGSTLGDSLIVWRPQGKPIAQDRELGLEDLEPRPLGTTNMESVCRAIAFATLGYWIQIYLDGLTEWDDSLTRTIGGWLARETRDGKDINARAKSLEEVCWAPVDSAETAALLVQFLHGLGASRDLDRAFEHTRIEMERSPSAPVPGWPAMERQLGIEARIGIRRAFRAGIDLDIIEKMRERYVLNAEDNTYADRESLLKGIGYVHKFDGLVHEYGNQAIFIKGKPYNPFRLYAQSELRNTVRRIGLYPGAEPASLLRYSPLHGILTGEDFVPDEYLILNTYRGFVIKPSQTIDDTLMSKAVGMLDTMLSYLTQANDAQILWLKKFIAWTIQHPAIKQQVCPIIIGGQGIGKSVFGDEFMRAMFGELAGAPSNFSPDDNKFFITPFIGKLITFIDEVRLKNRGTIDELKKLIRTVHLSGQEKYVNERVYDVYSRVLLAANQPDIGLTSADSADRAFFFIMAFTAENKRMLTQEFQAWAATLKPFYNELIESLRTVPFRQHLMRHFMDLECTREELEDLTHSSRDAEEVVTATMSEARMVARRIVEDARVIDNQDITALFSVRELGDAIKRAVKELNLRGASTPQVKMEYERAGVLEVVGEKMKFKYRYASLLEELGKAHNLPIQPQHLIRKDEDYGLNLATHQHGNVKWRGLKESRSSDDSPSY